MGLSEENLESQSNSVLTSFYKEVLNEGDIVYDIGAYRGVTASGFADLGCIVEAFEGAPSNLGYLYLNAELMDGVNIHPVAVGDREGWVTTKFNDCNAPMGEHKEQRIRMVQLNEYCRDLSEPRFVKMDIEGSESTALTYATNLLWGTKPIWQLSLHPNQGGYGKNYPGWVPKDKGGFDFDLIPQVYTIYRTTDLNTRLESFDGFGEYILIPK